MLLLLRKLETPRNMIFFYEKCVCYTAGTTQSV